MLLRSSGWVVLILVSIARWSTGKNNGCDEFGQGVVCYDGSNHPLLLSVVKQVVPNLILKNIPDVAQDACVYSATKQLSFFDENSSKKLPVVVIKPAACYSFGNMVGSFYEALSFGERNNHIIFHANGDCEGMAHNASLIAGLPRIYIPSLLSTPSLTSELCKIQIPSRSPWDNENSLFWAHMNNLTAINHRMVKYFLSQSSVSSLSVSDMKNSLAIHFRCSDNVISNIYGVFPFSTYKFLLSELSRKYLDRTQQRMDSGGRRLTSFSKITIFSDAKESGAYGTLCWNLLGLFRDKLMTFPGYQDMRVDIVYASPASTILLMHHAKAVICSVSTFCFFANLGSSDTEVVYLHNSKKLINAPDSFWGATSTHKYLPFESKTLIKDDSSDWKTFIKRVSTS